MCHLYVYVGGHFISGELANMLWILKHYVLWLKFTLSLQYLLTEVQQC
jgi:hypothetical protein